MEKDGYAIKMLPLDENIYDEAVVLESEETLTPYETVEEMETIAVYQVKDESYSYEYTSLNQGIKESIILNEKPESNIFRFSLELTKMTAELKEEENTILLKDSETEETVAVIEKPFMNDATGEAYSEDLVYSLEEVSEGSYMITLTVSRKYLNSVERMYPVTIDPTATWKGDESFLDAYVINGSYADTNFYDPDVRIMAAGVGSLGTYRTYFKLPNLKATLEDKYVHTAYLTVYETGSSAADQTIRLNRITESWTVSSLTWNNKPAYNTAAYATQFTTDGTQYKAHQVAITSTVRNFVNSNNHPNYGLVMRNVTSSPSYAAFYGSRFATAAYRPKLVVTYYDKPTPLTSLSLSRKSGDTYITSSYMKKGNNVYASWEGIVSHNLADVQYKITGTSGTADPTSVGTDGVDLTSYRSLGVATEFGTNVKIPYALNLPAGVYRVYVRGKDAGGMYGTGKYKNIYVDGDTPTLTDVTVAPSSSESTPTNVLTPTLSWNASDTYFSKVTLSVDGGTAQTLSTTSGAGSYTLPSGAITTSGTHTLTLKAVDKSGKSTSSTIHYYVDTDAPVVTASVTPETADGLSANETRPQVSWQMEESDLKQVEILLNGESKAIITDSTVTSYQFAENVLTASGKYTITIKATDTAGNTSETVLDYYLDVDKPVFSALSLTPATTASAPSGNKSPVLSWTITDTALDEVSYSLDGETYTEMEDSKNGTFTIPSTAWGNDIGTFTIYVKAVDTAGNVSDIQTLTYYLDAGVEFIPTGLSVAEYYGKRMVSWNVEDYDETKIAYDLHRGTTASFTPSESTLVESGINGASELYIDKEILESGTYYYKIVVRKVCEDELVQGGTSNETSIVNAVTLDQFSNTMGQKEYLSYLEMGLPMGDISVEESSGNLMYSQSDFSVSNAQLDYGLDRIYNSRSKRTSMFGQGWSDSYHRELYTSGTDIYFVDNDGSSYRFVLENGAYVCEETLNYTLTVTETGYQIVTKEDLTYTFNTAGQLVKLEEPNGCGISYTYDQMGRLYMVVSKEGKEGEKGLILRYSNKSYLLMYLSNFTGTVNYYSYSEGKLIKNENYSGKESQSFDYTYGTSDLLESIADGLDNLYSVTYSGGKATSLFYPDGEKYVLTYGTGSTEIEKYTPSQVKIHEEVITYDPVNGRLLSYQDAEGNTTTYEYTEANPYLLARTKAKKGYQTLSDGVVVFNETAVQSEVEYEYNSDENLVKTTDADGTVTTYTYKEGTDDIANEVTVKEGTTLSNTSYEYDDAGNVEVIEDAITDTVETSTHDSEGNVTSSVTTEEGAEISVTESEYDDQGNLLSESTTSGVVEENSSTSTYDKMGRVLQTVENGVTTTNEYDFMGRVVKTTISEAGKADMVETKVYNANGTLVEESSTAGVTKTYTYDSRNRLIKEVTSGEGIETRISETSYGYEQNVVIHDGTGTETIAVAYKTVTKDTAGNVLSTSYTDALGRTVKEVAGGVFTDYTYDRSSNQVISYTGTTADDAYLVTLALFDEEGRSFAEVVNPQITDSSYSIGETTVASYSEYDVRGNVSKETDAKGVVTTYTYDEEGKLLTCDIAGDGVDVTASYVLQDNGGELVTVTDANGNIKQELTDASGVTLQTLDQDKEGSEHLNTSYEYDGQGRVTKEIYNDNSYKTYAYEGDSERVASEKTYLADETLEDETIYSYDTYGRVSQIQHKSSGTPVSTYAYTYDVEGKVVTESVSYGTEEAGVTAYTYDTEGRLQSITYPSASGIGTASYNYDSLGRIGTVTNGNEVIREYAYDSLGRVESIKDYDEPGSTSYILKAYGYDLFGRTTEAVYTEDGNASKVLESYSYSYDKNSNIVSETRISNLPESVINETRDYIYDSYGRLTKSTITDHMASDAKTITEYGYDAVGNRTSKTEAGVVTTYTYNGLNQLTMAETADTEILYEYDSRGNQVLENNTTTGETQESSFNVAGEMVELVKKSNGTESFTQTNKYNHEGIRVARTQDSVTREYYYGNGSVAYTEDNNVVSSANIQSTEGSVISTKRGDTYYNYLKNFQGSTSGIVSEAGEAVAVYTYTDFGETEEVTGGTFENDICYTGAIYDKETGLYYMNARYYDPVNARFISQDTYRGEIGDAGTWHLYAYCANNPINYVDPSGHKKKLIGAGIQVSVSASASFVDVGVGIEIIYFFKQIKSGVYAYWYGEAGTSTSALKKGMKKVYDLIIKEPENLFSKPSFECAICAFAVKSESYNTKPRSYEGTFTTRAASGFGFKGFVSTGGGFRTVGAGKNFGNGGLACSKSKYYYIGNVNKIFGSLKNKIKEKANKFFKK